MAEKYIIKRKNGYYIQKRINKKLYHFGLYDTLEEAIHYRDYFIEHNWDMNLRLEFSKRKKTHKKEPKNIYKRKNGGYKIVKKINHYEYHFGCYDTLEEAITARDYFVKTGWRINERLIHTNVSNIIENEGKYYIIKRINGKQEYFGVYHTLEEAQEEVRLLRQCNWDYDILCESIDETENGVIPTPHIKFGGTFQKKKERNDYYYAKNAGMIK